MGIDFDALARAARDTLAAPFVRPYHVVVKEAEARFTLGVAYPADSLDADNEMTTAAELERAAHTAMARPGGIRIGVLHKDGTEGAGIAVESYINRGPSFELNGQRIATGDWVLGVVWDAKVWAAIKAGQLQGFSIQGSAQSRPRSARPN